MLNLFNAVPSCEPPQWPNNGDVHCDKSEIIAGTACNVRCFPGFKMNPQTPNIKCLNKNNKASMDRETPFCEGLFSLMINRHIFVQVDLGNRQTK